MSDVTIFGGDRKALAVELLGAALALDLDPTVVRTTSKGFRVPRDVADAAGYGDLDEVSDPETPAVTPEPTNENPDSAIVDGVVQKAKRPKDTDNKGAWIEFAKAHGADEAYFTDADGKDKTKAAIIADYGNKE
jgi:hypothetical protein